MHSLALVADSFHMLNDVLSLCVGLWAVKVANGKSSSKMYTYGWQRAETLGALVNGVFLVALCLSIFLEAIQRFVRPQTVSNPKLVLVVGCFGLLSNILGLFLFHEHGHSHGGGHGHSHGGADKLGTAEEGHSHGASGGHTNDVADEGGNVADVLPQQTIAGWPKSQGMSGATRKASYSEPIPSSKDFTKTDEEETTIAQSSTSSPLSMRKPTGTRRHQRHNSRGSRARYSSVDDIHIHPASFRNDIIAASRLEDIESRDGSDFDADEEPEEEPQEPTETTSLLHNGQPNGKPDPNCHSQHKHTPDNRHDSWHTSHKHAQPKEASTSDGGHSHADLNMRGVFLHVLGDALGNIGVIASALIIWLTHSPFRFYTDPLISLIITLIILGSAIPLCKAASRILLQAVPAGISVDDIKGDIEELPGILSCHHLHVWQLSDVKWIASLHVQVEFDFKGEGSARYMQLARAIRRCLHEHGIHSSTIQPEFCLDSEHRHTASGAASDTEGPNPSSNNGGSGKGKDGSKGGSQAASIRSQTEACLLDCGDECDEGGQCCTPKAVETDMHEEHSGHGHSH